jgi:hypothetical protein
MVACDMRTLLMLFAVVSCADPQLTIEAAPIGIEGVSPQFGRGTCNDGQDQLLEIPDDRAATTHRRSTWTRVAESWRRGVSTSPFLLRTAVW